MTEEEVEDETYRPMPEKKLNRVSLSPWLLACGREKVSRAHRTIAKALRCSQARIDQASKWPAERRSGQGRPSAA